MLSLKDRQAEMKERLQQERADPRYRRFLAQAKWRNIPVTLSYAEFQVLQQDTACHYCHQEIRLKYGYGLDRVDNEQGYSQDNVVRSCRSCNVKKAQMLDRKIKAECNE